MEPPATARCVFKTIVSLMSLRLESKARLRVLYGEVTYGPSIISLFDWTAGGTRNHMEVLVRIKQNFDPESIPRSMGVVV